MLPSALRVAALRCAPRNDRCNARECARRISQLGWKIRCLLAVRSMPRNARSRERAPADRCNESVVRRVRAMSFAVLFSRHRIARPHANDFGRKFFRSCFAQGFSRLARQPLFAHRSNANRSLRAVSDAAIVAQHPRDVRQRDGDRTPARTIVARADLTAFLRRE